MKTKQIILTLLLLQSTIFFYGQKADTLAKNQRIILKYDIKREIGPAVWRQTMQAFDKAEEVKAQYILIHMNTYGGLVDAADSIRTKILNSKIPVMVFIDNNAASAGALISIACDSIYMRAGANIGAATVVNQSGAAMPDKYQSYMRSTMRATAEAHGKDTIINGRDTTYRWIRDPQIAEAMVDQRKYIEGISDSGEVITFTANEAIKHHYCEGIAENVEEVLEKANLKNYEIVEYTPSSLEKIMGMLVSPYLQGVLIMIMIGGIYFELQTPGIGFALGAAILAAILYFAPLYLEGIAENWEILIFVIGIILILVEIFVIPGFGVAGISGIILTILGLALSMSEGNVFNWDNEFTFNYEPLMQSLFIVITSVLIAVLGSLIFSQQLVKTNLFNAIALNKTQKIEEGYLAVNQNNAEMLGKIGKTHTVLRPGGKVEIEGEIYDAKAIIGFIDKDKKVEVIKYEMAQLYVSEIK